MGMFGNSLAQGAEVGGMPSDMWDRLGSRSPVHTPRVDRQPVKVPTINQPGFEGWLGRFIDPTTNNDPVRRSLGMFGQQLMAQSSGALGGLGRALVGVQDQKRLDHEAGLDRRYREAQIAEMERKATEPDVKVIGNNLVRFGRGGADPEAIYTAPMEGERYALSLGLAAGTPEYERAVQDYVLRSNGPTALDADQQMADYRQRLAIDRIGASGVQARRNVDYRERLTRSRPKDAKAMTTGNVVAPVLAKIAAGQPLSAGEQEVLRFYKPTANGKAGGPPMLSNSPARRSATPSRASTGKSAARYAVNPQTGERLQLVNGKWVPAR